ncbi:MAG: glycosyltransferase family 4 protein [Elusimicrobia bacterium]|nr:glycosyltransferase family 4 protein [Elusimicrobiota bacterium]
MNILHLVDEPYDSGIVNYALTAAAGLKERGHRVAVGGLAGKAPLEQAGRLGLETVSLRPLPAGALALRRLVRSLGVQVIDAHTGSSQTLAVAATRMLSKPPAVVRTRADASAPKRNPGARLLWNRTSGFIAATKTILMEFRAKFPEYASPARAILPGVADDGGPAAEPVQGPMRVGIIGRLDPVKGHVHFLRAAAKVLREMKDVVFVVAGREENLTIKQLHKVAESFGVARDVEFLGHVPDVSDIMRLCHIGVVASTGSEAVSRVAIEWMRIGRPLVATTVGGLPEFLGYGEVGLPVAPQDPDAMAQAILRLLRNPELRREQSRLMRRQYETHYTLSRAVNETEGFYEEILRGLPSR